MKFILRTNGYWNFTPKLGVREASQGELFHEIEVTAAHYTELQKRLTENDPHRDLPDYKSRDVLSIKSGILSFKPVQSPDVSLGQSEVENGEDLEDGLDDELRSFFPTTIKYLGLSSLEIVPSRMPRLSLIRQEYGEISVLLGELSKDDTGCAIVSGQPGTGKTIYLHLRVIEEIIAARPFLYQSLSGYVYHFSDTVTLITSWSSPEAITAFIDADQSLDPKRILIQPSIQIIAASSPKGTMQKWTKQGSPTAFVTNYVVSLWSPAELFLTGIFLYPRDVTYARLKESVTFLGYNPRRCFKASYSPNNLKQYIKEFENAVRQLPSNVTISSLLADAKSASGLSHSIFELSPNDDGRLLAEACIGAVSPYALNCLLTEWETRQREATDMFYHSIAGNPMATSLRSRILERQVLKYFDSLSAPQVFNIRSLDDSTIVEWSFPSPTERHNLQSQSFATSLRRSVDANQSLRLVPRDVNFPAVVSILYDIEMVLAGIQVTITDGHPVAVSGLKRVQRWLKPKTPLAGLRPSASGDHWKLIFVVPNDMADSFEKQTLKGDSTKGEWASKVDQYVLGIPDDILWGRTSA